VALPAASDERAGVGPELMGFPEVFDLEAARFKPEFLDNLARAKEASQAWGAPLLTAPSAVSVRPRQRERAALRPALRPEKKQSEIDRPLM
jgi:hypothetical protein